MTSSAPPVTNRPKPNTTAPARVGESGWQRAIPYTIFALVVFVVLALMTLIFGQVSGEEFCPDTFERRTFYYYQIPLLRLQVTKVTRKDAGLGMADTVVDHAPNVIATPAVKNWDLVSSQRIGAFEWLGDAKILCDLLRIRDHKRRFKWEEWSEQYPQLADVFWPVVADVAQAGSYILLPEIFEMAENAGHDASAYLPEDEDDSEEVESDEEDDGQSDESQTEPKKTELEVDEQSEKTDENESKKKKDDNAVLPGDFVSTFKSDLESFVGAEQMTLANQFENGDELRLAKRAYRLAIDYTNDPAAEENLDRLTRLVPDEDVILDTEKTVDQPADQSE